MKTVSPRAKKKGGRAFVRPKSFCEFFAGVGLVREGLAASGWECLYANDFSAKKQEIYAARFGADDHFHLADVGETDEVIARITGTPFLATASFPCIDMSLAGHYRGFQGEHSSTFFGFAKVLKALDEKRPPLVMLENVPGFLSSAKGQDFQTVAHTLADLGYWLDVFILDARYFVPQSRPRVFVVGMSPDLKPKPKNKTNGWLWDTEEVNELRPELIVRIKEQLQLSTGWVSLPLPNPPKRDSTLAELIDVDDKQEWWVETETTRHYLMMSELHRGQVDQIVKSKQKWVGTIFRRNREKGMRSEVRFDGLAGCLRTPKGGSAKQIVIAIDSGRLRMRWMSPREYARLQGVPEFPLVGTTIQQLWGFADAVCVPAIAWIDRHVLTPLYESASQRNGHARQPHASAASQDNAGGQRKKHLA